MRIQLNAVLMASILVNLAVVAGACFRCVAQRC